MRLSVAQERFQKNAVIVAARQTIYAAAILKYGKGITIGDVAKIVTKGTTPKTYGFDFVKEGVPFLQAEDVLDGQVLYEGIPFHIDAETNNFMDRSRTQSGDVLVTIAGSIGRAAVVPRSAPELNMNQAVALIRCKDEINPYFLCHMLQSPEVQKQIFSSTVTTAISNLSLGKIKEIIIPFPPLADQEAIAEFLEAVQKHHAYEGLSKNLPGYMQQVPRIIARIEELAARIEEARGLRREAVEETEKLWDSSLRAMFDQLAKVYQNKTFREVCDVVRGGSPRPAGDPTYYDGSIPFLKVADLTSDTNRYVTKYSTTIKEAGLRHSRYVAPDTLMLTNSGATLGVPKICTFGTCFNDGIQALLNIPNDIAKEFLYYFLLSKTRWFRDWVARGQGQPNLNTEMVKGMEFPLPPLVEQRRIVAYLDELQARVDSLKQLQSETSAELDVLLPSILDKPFKGEL